MLVIFIYWIFIFLSLSFWGKLFLKWCGEAGQSNPFRVALYGLPLAILCLGILGFFFPGKYLLGVNIITSLVYVFNRENRNELKSSVLPKIGYITLFAGIIAFFSLRGYVITDHYFYYLPSELWIWQYGWVKGLSNLYLPLGQGSFWHMYEATWNSGEWPILNGFLSTAVIGMVWVELKLKRVQAAILLIPILFAYLFSSANSPDYALIVLGTLMTYEWLAGRNVAFVWPFLLVGIKLVGLPYLLLSGIILFGFLRRYNHSVKNLLLFSFGLAILAGVRNVFQTGVLLYPYDFIPLNVFWKTPGELLAMFQQGIEAYGLNETGDLPKGSLSFFERLKLITSLPGIKGSINTTLVILFVVGILHLFWSSIKIEFIRMKLWSMVVLIVLYFFIWLYFAPQYRFFLPAIATLYAANVYTLKLDRFPLWLLRGSVWAVLLLFVSLALIAPKLTDNRLVSESWRKRQWSVSTLVIPKDVPAIKPVSYRKNEETYWYPEQGKYFGNTPLPGLFPYYDSLLLERGFSLHPNDSANFGRGFYLEYVPK